MTNSPNRITLNALHTLEAHLGRIKTVAFTSTTDAIANGLTDAQNTGYASPNKMITYAVDCLIDDCEDDPGSHSLTSTMMRDLALLLERISELDN